MAKFKITKQQVIDTIKKRWWIMLIELAALALILVLDQVSKKYVVEFLFSKQGQYYELAKGFIVLRYTENTGAGFGMFSGNTVALTVITAIVIVGIFVFLALAQKENEWLRISLVLICGGGIGNLIDRIWLGYVRDFIQFDFWREFAIFNVADFFVTVGTGMLIVILIVMLVSEGKKNKKEFVESQKKQPAQEAADPLDAPINLNPMMSSENSYTFAQSGNAENNVGSEKNENNADLKNAENVKIAEGNCDEINPEDGATEQSAENSQASETNGGEIAQSDIGAETPETDEAAEQK